MNSVHCTQHNNHEINQKAKNHQCQYCFSCWIATSELAISCVRRVRTLAGGQSLGILQLWSMKILQSRFVECTLFLENLRKSGWLNVLNHILRISYFSVHLYRPGHDLFPWNWKRTWTLALIIQSSSTILCQFFLSAFELRIFNYFPFWQRGPADIAFVFPSIQNSTG